MTIKLSTWRLSVSNISFIYFQQIAKTWKQCVSREAKLVFSCWRSWYKDSRTLSTWNYFMTNWFCDNDLFSKTPEQPPDKWTQPQLQTLGGHLSTAVVTWWRHQMETFSALLAFCAGNAPVTGEFPDKGQWRGALMFSLICAWINRWVNNGEAGDLTVWRHCNYTGIPWANSSNYVHNNTGLPRIWRYAINITVISSSIDIYQCMILAQQANVCIHMRVLKV